jgi:hypothetical protein
MAFHDVSSPGEESITLSTEYAAMYFEVCKYARLLQKKIVLHIKVSVRKGAYFSSLEPLHFNIRQDAKLMLLDSVSTQDQL